MTRFSAGRFVALCLAATQIVSVTDLEAGARRFTYVYEATTSAPGGFEFETWATWKTSPREQPRFNAVEFGIADRLQAALL